MPIGAGDKRSGSISTVFRLNCISSCSYTRCELLVWLPAYAPRLNLIDKLWRKFRQDIWYLHQQADDWKALQDQVHAFFDQLAPQLL